MNNSTSTITLEKGNLSSFSKVVYQIIESDQSAVSKGSHFILNLIDKKRQILSHQKLSDKEKGEAVSLMITFLKKQNPEGNWLIGLNGPGLVTRPTFHVHGIISETRGQIPRLVWNWKKWLDKLEEIVDQPTMPNFLKALLKGLLVEARKNMK